MRFLVVVGVLTLATTGLPFEGKLVYTITKTEGGKSTSRDVITFVKGNRFASTYMLKDSSEPGVTTLTDTQLIYDGKHYWQVTSNQGGKGVAQGSARSVREFGDRNPIWFTQIHGKTAGDIPWTPALTWDNQDSLGAEKASAESGLNQKPRIRSFELRGDRGGLSANIESFTSTAEGDIPEKCVLDAFRLKDGSKQPLSQTVVRLTSYVHQAIPDDAFFPKFKGEWLGVNDLELNRPLKLFKDGRISEWTYESETVAWQSWAIIGGSVGIVGAWALMARRNRTKRALALDVQESDQSH